MVVLISLCFFFFFFFQAEDGIRDLYVTGVQTCALPISRPTPTPIPFTSMFTSTITMTMSPGTPWWTSRSRCRPRSPSLHRVGAAAPARSEEHTSELQSRRDLVCRLLLEKKKKNKNKHNI